MTRTQNRSALRLLVVVVALMTVTGAFAPLAAAQDDSPPAPPHAVYGTVTDDAGDPVEGVTVEAVHDGEIVASDTTDGDGDYDVDVEGLDDGDEVTVSPATSSESETLTFSSGSADEVNFGSAESPPDDGDGDGDGEDGAGGGGGGGAGGGAPADGDDDDDEDDGITIVVEEEDSSVAIDDIDFSNDSATGEVTVVESTELDSDLPALPEGYRTVTVSNLTVPEPLRDEPATLQMNVSENRLDELDADLEELVVFRLPDDADSWEQLDSDVTETDAGATLEFEIPGFSTFAVAQQEAQDPTPTATDEGPTPTDEDPTDDPSDDGPDPMLLGFVVLVVLVIAVGAVYYFTQGE